MNDDNWVIHGREFNNCNCAYGCPCQFNALPTHGHCQAVLGIQIDTGAHGRTSLDGLRAAMIFKWPGPVHKGQGEAAIFIERRADPAQRSALSRILKGQDTVPGATIFQVFSTTIETLHPPVFADIAFEVDVNKRRARLNVSGHIETRGEPILNPVTGAEYRGRIDLPNGFEYTLAEMGRGWSKTGAPIALDFGDSYGQFAELHLGSNGVIRG